MVRCFLLGVILARGMAPGAAESTATSLPPFSEIYSLVHSNLAGVSEPELNRAAVMGFLGQLESRVNLMTNGVPRLDSPAVPLLSKSAIFDSAYGFLRIGRVGVGLSNEVARAYDQLRATNKLQGVVVDLRFALGEDYASAAETADLFFKDEQPLLQWAETAFRSHPKTSAIDLPLMILINHDTSGAAEAMAAALRQAHDSLIIGSSSAGRAFLYKELPLTNGLSLRVASGSIIAGNGQLIPTTGLQPDIGIAVKAEDEKLFFEDPYRNMTRPFAQSAKQSGSEMAGATMTNHSRRRLNEAELVRMQKDGLDLEGEVLTSGSAKAPGPVLTDPALSRALDLLKGLALAAKRP